jgi:hypothetical protein
VGKLAAFSVASGNVSPNLWRSSDLTSACTGAMDHMPDRNSSRYGIHHIPLKPLRGPLASGFLLGVSPHSKVVGHQPATARLFAGSTHKPCPCRSGTNVAEAEAVDNVEGNMLRTVTRGATALPMDKPPTSRAAPGFSLLRQPFLLILQRMTL